MPDRSPDGPPDHSPDAGRAAPSADPTRDITLPPLPDRPGPAVRPEWAPYVPAPSEAAPAASLPPGSTGRPRGSHDLPTDRMAGRDAPRSATLSFQPPPPVELLKVTVGARRRRGRWLWALAILLPLLVIAGSGIWLLVLFYGG